MRKGSYGNYTHQKSFFGIEIINNTAEKKDLRFLGMQHRHFQQKGVELRNLFNDTVYDDTDMTMLFDWLLSVGSIQAQSITFNSSLLYGAFSGKKFGVKATSYNGQPMYFERCLQSMIDHGQFNPTVVRLHTSVVIDAWTELSQTCIEAGERFIIIFNLGRDDSHSVMDDIVSKANNTFSKEKRRKILLIM